MTASRLVHPPAGNNCDTALRLAHFFGTSPEFWLNLQKLYELRLAEQKAGREIKELPTLESRETLPA